MRVGAAAFDLQLDLDPDRAAAAGIGTVWHLELKAARAGKVLTAPVKEGATVAAGEILATIG